MEDGQGGDDMWSYNMEAVTWRGIGQQGGLDRSPEAGGGETVCCLGIPNAGRRAERVPA